MPVTCMMEGKFCSGGGGMWRGVCCVSDLFMIPLFIFWGGLCCSVLFWRPVGEGGREGGGGVVCALLQDLIGFFRISL